MEPKIKEEQIPPVISNKEATVIDRNQSAKETESTSTNEQPIIADVKPMEPVSLWTLFKSTFMISAFTVGGGFVLIPLMKAKFVDEYRWISDKDALNLVAIAQSAPGVVAVNASIILGYRMAGMVGMFTALLATVLPPLIMLTAISYFYEAFASNYYVKMLLKGMQCGVTAVILKVVIDLLMKQFKKKLVLPLLIMIGSFIGSYVFDINIMYIILVDAIVGIVLMQSPKYD